MNPRDEQRLRELLDDAVSDVEPRSGLDAIQSRTKVSTMSTRPWFLAAGAAVAATAATIAAFAVLGDTETTSSNPDPVASGTPSPDTATDTPSKDPSPTVETVQVPVYYVSETGQGPRLYREFHAGPAGDELTAAVDHAVSRTPDDPDYFTPWPGGASAGQVDFDGEIITIDLQADGGAETLRNRPRGMEQDVASMAVEQLMYTAQAALQEGRPPIQFLINGGRTDMVLGVPTSEPLAQGDETSTLAQVWIIDPAEGAKVDSGFEVSGIGAFFEANVVWELRQGTKVVKDGFTTAEECCRMAPYSFTVDAPPGDYTLVVTDSDASGGQEGFAPFQDTKNITIR
jgi:hypothetical protein